MGATRNPLVMLFTVTLAACGGGGGGSDEPLSLYTPSVTVSGLDVGETASFTLAGQAFAATTNTTYSYSGSLTGSYTASVTASPAGKTCRFNGTSTSYSGSSSSITLVCGTSTTGGGGSGTATPINGPFQFYGWFTAEESSTSPLITSVVSLLDFNGVGLTGATTDNFTFYDNDMEIVNSPEFKLYVQPITVGTVQTQAALALDISTSFSATNIATMKQQVTDFLAGIGPRQQFRISVFDDAAVELVPYTSDIPTLQAGVASIPEAVDARGASTNLYGAAQNAATSAGRNFTSLDYIVIVTDGEHTTDASTFSDIADDMEFQLVFAIAVGGSANIGALEELVSVGEQTATPDRVIQISDMSQLGTALNQVAGYVNNMVAGLHHIHYVTPRRGDTFEFRRQAKPYNDCLVGVTILGCEWFAEYDATSFVSNSSRIYVFANTAFPEAGKTVRLQIPNWESCAPTPDYQWAITATTGTATGTVVAGTNQTSFDLALGATAPLDITVDVTDNNSACTGNLRFIVF